jgi:hypothetical protein
MDQTQIREQIEALLTEADAAIVNDIRNGGRSDQDRLAMLNELDALERVRERFYAIWGA